MRFRDGIGVRIASADAFGEPIEQLQLCADLAALESAVRERVSRLINFRHVRYVRLRGSERLTNATKDVVVTYDAVPGTRLSEFLDLALHAPLRIDIDTALQIVRELLPAIAVLHDSRNVTHGAISPERLVLTPQGRLVIVDHGLGLALGKLGYSRKRFWQQLRVPVPQGTGKIVFDARTDVIQIGMVALALLHGRPIDEADFPQNLERLLDTAKETPSIGQPRPLSSELRAWLDRALPLEKRVAFATVREAQQEFEKLFGGTRYGANSNALKNLATKYAAVAQGKAAPVEDAPAAAASEPIGAPLENMIERGLGSGRRGDSPPPLARPDDQVSGETEVAVTSLADAVGLGPKGRVRAIRKALVTPISELSVESFRPKDVAPNALAPKAPASTAPVVNAPAKDTRSSSTGSSIKAKGVDVTAPNAKVAAAKGAQKPAASAPLSRDVAAFEEVASDTYTDAQVSIATKGTQAAPVAPSAKSSTSADADAQSILLMDAVDDETPLVPASAFEEAAPDLDRFAGMGAKTVAKGIEVTPAAKAPEAKVPDVKVAEVKSPALKAPAAKIPATIKTADLKAAEPKPAEPKMPALKVEVKTPDVKAPTAKAPVFKAPAVNAPAVIAPAAKAPAANVPSTIAPAATVPAISAPAAKVPAVNVPSPNVLSPNVPPVNVPAANVPAASPLFSATPAAPVTSAAPFASNVPAPVAKATPPSVMPAVPTVPVVPAASTPAAPIATVTTVLPASPSVVPPVAKIPLPGTPTSVAQPAMPPAAVAPPKVSVPLPSVVLPAVTPVVPAASIATPSEPSFVPLPVSKAPAPPVVPVAPPFVALTPVAPPPVARTPVAAPPVAPIAVAPTPVAPAPVGPPLVASTRVVAPPVASTPVAAAPVAPPVAVTPVVATPVVAPPVVAAPVAKAPIVAPRPVFMPDLPEPDLFAEPAPVVVEEPARKKSLASKLWAAVPKPKKAAPPPSIVSLPSDAEDFASAPPVLVAPAATQVPSAPAASATPVARTVVQPAAPASAKPAPPVTPVAPAAVSPLAPAARVNTPAVPTATPAMPPKVAAPPSSGANTPAAPAPDTSFDWHKDVAVTDAIPAWARGRVAGDGERGDDAVVDFDEASGSLSSAVGAAASRAADVNAASNVSAFMAAPKPVVVKTELAATSSPSSSSSSSSSSSASSSEASQRMLLRPGSGFFGADAAAEAEEAADKVVAFKAPRRQMPRIRVNWRRTLAASLVVSLLEGVAFATAYWYVVPTETGSLLVETTPAGIDILVDGRLMGRTPFSDSMTPGRHTIELRQGANSRVLPVEISSGVQTMQRITWAKGLQTGQARVTATAANSHVTIDGKKWGKAPLTISTLAAGKHMVSIESDAGTVSTPIAVSPGETTELDVPVYPGWVSVLAPVQLFIYEGERFLGTTEGEKLMLAPGKHTLDFVSEELGYKRTLEVTITPGATAAVSLPMPKVAVTVEGPEGADLIVDGEAMGKLPVTGLQVALGTRDFVVRHPDHSEKRQVVTVTNHAPMRVSLR